MWLIHFLCALLIIPSICYGSPEELKLIYDRKVNFIIQDYSANFNSIPTWLANYSAVNGTWSDVDYTSGCPARRANWPAQQHFLRIATMASQYRASNNETLLPIISKAMDYWFDNNYVPDACLDLGGVEGGGCPCGTPGFWNTNWFGQMILMPRFISNSCLLLKSNLTATQLGNCTLVSQRVYNRIDTVLTGIGPMTGANMLDSATSVLNLGLLTDNETIAKDAINHFYNQTLITPETGSDGIKVDGSYLQHFSQLYNGNYGKDFINSVVAMYILTSDTSYSAPPDSQAAFLTLMDGTEWMIVSNHTSQDNSSLLWEYSVIGRMVSFVASDKQASGGVALNLTRIALAAADWPNATALHAIVERLNEAKTDGSTQGNLSGTRGFYTSDYLVHRDTNYVTTLKSFSQRTSNSECNNNQNPFGFHLSDGSLFTYIDGDEYLDVFGAYDWNLIPGTTVDYGATPLNCNQTQFYGNTSFVGSVTPTHNGDSYSTQGGMAVMQYLNPLTGGLRWEKTFFFFPGIYAVQIGPIYSQTTAPIVTTLDQSNLKGEVYINGQILSTDYTTTTTTTTPLNVWHNRILYTLVSPNATLKVNTDNHVVNNWSTIGISQGQATQRIFTATLEHPPVPLLASTADDDDGGQTTAPVSYYVAQLNTDTKQQTSLDDLVQLVYQEDSTKGRVRGAYYVPDGTIALAFWTPGQYASSWNGGVSVASDQPILTYLSASEQTSYLLTVADPTQLLTNVTITVTTQHDSDPYVVTISLPQSPHAGQSVSVNIP